MAGGTTSTRWGQGLDGLKHGALDRHRAFGSYRLAEARCFDRPGPTIAHAALAPRRFTRTSSRRFAMLEVDAIEARPQQASAPDRTPVRNPPAAGLTFRQNRRSMIFGLARM